MIRWCPILFALVGLLLFNIAARAQDAPVVKAFPPFKIVGNIYYVGDTNEGVYLITTLAGHILLDTGYEETVPIVKAGVENLGFRMQDIKIMISGHRKTHSSTPLAAVSSSSAEKPHSRSSWRKSGRHGKEKTNDKTLVGICARSRFLGERVCAGAHGTNPRGEDERCAEKSGRGPFRRARIAYRTLERAAPQPGADGPRAGVERLRPL